MVEGRVSTRVLAWQQVRYQNRLFWRTPLAAFFTLAFPLMFLLLFATLFGTEKIEIPGRGTFSVAQFYAPALAVFAAATATYTNIGIQTAIARDQGILKRFRGTPLPSWTYMAGRIGSGVWIAFLAVAIMVGVGVLAYDLTLDPAKLPALLLTFAVGAACFAALGLALAAVAPNGDSAPAIANATILPLAFVSDVFIAMGDPPQWLTILGNIFPLKHFVRAFQDAFQPTVDPPAFAWDHLAVMAAWGVAGALFAIRFFTWEPRESSGGRRLRRRKIAAG
ncbi:MAG: ABC transporter permease [Acidimicrobiia bacterium]|nr:MAG: ABC transporter permease [Acidimicrobiia bacterium]